MSSFHVNDVAYMWYPQTNHNSTGLLGSILKVKITECIDDSYQVVILLSGRPTVATAKGEVFGAEEDELFETTEQLLISLQDQYQTYLNEQVDNLIKYKDREYDPDRVS